MYADHNLASLKPMCGTCRFVLPSETSSTGLRCGEKYYRSSLLMRKFQLMQHFQEVKDANACESWAAKTQANDPGDETLAKQAAL